MLARYRCTYCDSSSSSWADAHMNGEHHSFTCPRYRGPGPRKPRAPRKARAPRSPKPIMLGSRRTGSTTAVYPGAILRHKKRGNLWELTHEDRSGYIHYKRPMGAGQVLAREALDEFDVEGT